MEPQLAQILDEVVKSLEELWAQHRALQAVFLADHVLLSHVMTRIDIAGSAPEVLDRLREDARHTLLHGRLIGIKEPDESIRRDACARLEALFDQIAKAPGSGPTAK